MALDKGHEYADDELKKLEKKLHMEYSKAFREMKKKADVYFNAFKKEDAKQLSDLNEGKITEEQYKRWRMSSMAMGERYTNMVAKLAEDLTNTNKIAMAMIDPTLKSAYAENYNYGGYEIAKGMKMNIAWDLMDVNTVERLIKDDPKVLPKPRVDIPRDRRWNQQKIRSAITQGIMQGEPVNKIANRLKQVTDMSDSAAIRNARTATTGAENAGRQRSYDHAAKDLGTEMEKVWVATPDSRTRDSHRMLDLETVPYNEPFSNGLMYPGDSSGEPQEVYNCRCTMIGKPKYFKYDMTGRYSKLGDTSYEEWKRGHQSYSYEEDKDMFSDFDDNRISKQEYLNWQNENATSRKIEEEFEKKYGCSIEEAHRTKDEWINDEKKWTSELADEATEDLRQVQNGYGHCGYIQSADGSKEINKYLRTGEIDGIYSKKEVTKTIDAMNRLIDKSIIDKDMVVDRCAGIDALSHMGIDVGDVGKKFRIGHAFCTEGIDVRSVVDNINKNYIGTTIIDEGFMSASVSASSNIFGGSDVTFSILAPKGTHAFVSDNLTEAEVVFAPKTNQEIIGARVQEREAVDYEGNKTKREVIEILLKIV